MTKIYYLHNSKSLLASKKSNLNCDKTKRTIIVILILILSEPPVGCLVPLNSVSSAAASSSPSNSRRPLPTVVLPLQWGRLRGIGCWSQHPIPLSLSFFHQKILKKPKSLEYPLELGLGGSEARFSLGQLPPPTPYLED